MMVPIYHTYLNADSCLNILLSVHPGWSQVRGRDEPEPRLDKWSSAGARTDSDLRSISVA
jgi:hypothetical protein